ncbi:MAG: hypothetical protein FJ102_25515 [Deltaproteobacteria bacterium]|nr:hypothetical protein [Deltaproteobacteria bacterium]
MILLVACAASEAERLAAGATAESYESSVATCAEMRGQKRDDCLLAAMREHDRRVRADCDLISEARAKGECLFAYAERVVKDNPAEAMDACAATQFARECSYHLLREAARTVEEKLPAEAAAAIEPWRSISAVHDPDRLFWKAYFRERVDRKLVVDPEGCPGPECRAGARETIISVLNGRLKADPSLCTAVVTDERWVDSATTRGWIDAWKRNECTRSAE